MGVAALDAAPDGERDVLLVALFLVHAKDTTRHHY
jgi:hypothetical protein